MWKKYQGWLLWLRPSLVQERLSTINYKRLSFPGALQGKSTLKSKFHCFPQANNKKKTQTRSKPCSCDSVATLHIICPLPEREMLNTLLNTLLEGAQLCWGWASNGNWCETQPRDSVMGLSSMLRQGSCEVTICFLPPRDSACMKTIIKYSVSLGKTGGRW